MSLELPSVWDIYIIDYKLHYLDILYNFIDPTTMIVYKHGVYSENTNITINNYTSNDSNDRAKLQEIIENMFIEFSVENRNSISRLLMNSHIML